MPYIQNLDFNIEYNFIRYRSNKLQYRIASISQPDIEGSTFDIKVSSISKVFCQLQYQSKYFDIEGCVFDIEGFFDIKGFNIEETFDIGGGKVPDESVTAGQARGLEGGLGSLFSAERARVPVDFFGAASTIR